jgi:hypothetical protein
MKTLILSSLIPFILLTPSKDYRINDLRSWFAKYESPLIYYVDDFTEVADEFNLDWRLLPAIATQESGCAITNIDGNNNPFGWNSDQTKFYSYKAAIWFVGWQMAYGQYYQGKSLDEKLETYNQNEGYGARIKKIMEMISDV